MRQQNLVSGFSELKDLLITTYKIEKPRELVQLYFSQSGMELLMHDYDDHKKVMHLCFDIRKKQTKIGLKTYAERLVNEALTHHLPSAFLNHNFKLYGFFRSQWK